MTGQAAPPRWLLRVRALLGIVAFGLLGLVGTQLAAWLLFGAASQGGTAVAAWARDQATGELFLGGLAASLGFLAATLIVGRIGYGLTWTDLRWRGTGRALPATLIALVVSAGLAALVLVGGSLLGSARWVPDQGTAGMYLGRIGLVFLLLAPAALAEEIIFRGVPLVLLDRVVNRGFAVGATALVFALAHSANPEVTTLSIGNICVAGLLIGTAFYAPGGLWTAWGVHLGWNWAIAALDAPVSGLDLRIPFINYEPGGPAWLTGGAFGPEGGVLATLVLGLATVLATRWILHRPQPEPAPPAGDA